MAKCELSGKKRLVGYSVSHAHNKHKKYQFPNIQKKRFFVPEYNKWITLRVSTRTIRTITKYGLVRYAKKNNINLAKYLER